MSKEERDNVIQLSPQEERVVYLTDLAIADLVELFPEIKKELHIEIVSALVDLGYMFDEPLDGEYILEATLIDEGVNDDNGN